MSKYSRKNKISDETKNEALKVARGTQRPGQTKEQTKLIAQGIQKGIDTYKKQQKSKARELDKKLKQVSSNQNTNQATETTKAPKASNQIAWYLLIASWTGFIIYIFISGNH